MTRTVFFLAALALAVGCGSGGPAALTTGDGGGGGNGGGGGGSADSALAQRLIVQDDHDGDGELDLLTLDTSEQPFRIVEVILGNGAGAPTDATALFRGQQVDVAVSEALGQYLSNSFRVGERTPLDVRDSIGRTRSIVVFE